MNDVGAQLQVQVRTRAARAWIIAMRILGPFVGRDRAARWGWAGGWKLVRVRLGANGRWARIDPRMFPPQGSGRNALGI